MDATQYARWEDFALRMARHGWPGMTEQRKQRLVDDVTAFLEAHRDYAASIISWDDGDDGCVCDWVAEWFDEHDHGDGHNRYWGQLHCCLRAGLDVAAESSAGVLGFTAGDLRRMYDGAIPAWLTEQYTSELAIAPDDAGVWL